MIIELYGLAGSGKTTFAERLAERGDYKIIRIRGRLELVWLNFIFMLKRPVSFFNLIVYVLHNSNSWKLFYYKFMNVFLHCNAKYEKALRYDNALIDQGYAQNIISLFEREISAEDLRKYFSSTIIPDKLVIFDMPETVRMEHIEKRRYESRDDFDATYRELWKKLSKRNHRLFLDNKNIYKGEIIMVKNKEDFNKFSLDFKNQNIGNLFYLSNSRIPTEKAHGFQICKMCEEYASLGLSVKLIAPKRKNAISEDVFDFYNLKKNFSVTFLTMPDFISRNKYLGRVSNFLQSLFFLISLYFTKFPKQCIIYTRDVEIAWIYSKRRKVVYEAHNWPVSKVGLYVRMLKNVYLIVCNSKGTESKFIETGFINTLIAPNGVDLKRFQIEKTQNEARTHLGLPLDKKIIMYVGQFYLWKGVDILLNAWNTKFADNARLALYLVGGNQKDLKENIKIASNVFLRGYQNRESIPYYLKASDILVLPNNNISLESKFYTSPIKMFEYMASKKPIVASKLPSIQEILNDNNCVFFESGNAKDLADKIEKLIFNEKLSAALSSQAFNDVINFTWSNRAKKIIGRLQ